MKEIEVVNGDPILDYSTMISAGKEVKAGLHYDHFEDGACRSNLEISNNKVKKVAYDTNMRIRVLEDLILVYGGRHNPRELMDKLKEFDLVKLK